MTIFGYDIPLVGPVLQQISDAVTAAGVGVNVTGSGITVSVGTVSVSGRANVSPTGNAITVSAGSVHRPTYVTGNLIGVVTGGVAVSTDNDGTVGVSGAGIAFSIGTCTFVTSTNVFPDGEDVSFSVGQAVTPQSIDVNLTGNAITFNAGDVSINNFVPLVRSFDPATANLSGSITDLVVEDDYDLETSILGVPSGAVLEEAWLTIKEDVSDDDADAILQKVITSISVSDVGQITDTGASGTGNVVFQLTAAETDTLVPGQIYYYDIQVKTDTNKHSTREKGILIPVGQITDSL